MLLFAFILTVIIQIAVPILLGWFLIRRYSSEWKLVAIGAIVFLASQIVHLPLTNFIGGLFRDGVLPMPAEPYLPVFYAVVGGLLAALCEEPARYIGLRFLKEQGKPWGNAMTMGAGHGGIESIFIGINLALTVFTAYNLAQTGAPSTLTEAEVVTLQQQLAQFFAMPWFMPFASALERMITLVLQMTLTAIVWLAVVKKAWIWLLAAILWHTAINAVAVFLGYAGWDVWAVEAVLTGVALLNLGIIYFIRTRIMPEQYAVVPAVEEAK
jgi:uncharacterized membrane protein YhfC